MAFCSKGSRFVKSWIQRFNTLIMIRVHLTCELNYQGVDGISISELKSAVVSDACVQFTLTSHKQFATGQQLNKGMKSMTAN